MEEENHYEMKKNILGYVERIFREMEENIAMSHQEKYALLEDSFEVASDVSELKIAFEQWYNDHLEEVDFEHDMNELWEQASLGEEE